MSRWYVRIADEDSLELEKLLADGWEPFAARTDVRDGIVDKYHQGAIVLRKAFDIPVPWVTL